MPTPRPTCSGGASFASTQSGRCRPSANCHRTAGRNPGPDRRAAPRTSTCPRPRLRHNAGLVDHQPNAAECRGQRHRSDVDDPKCSRLGATTRVMRPASPLLGAWLPPGTPSLRARPGRRSCRRSRGASGTRPRSFPAGSGGSASQGSPLRPPRASPG